MWNKPVIPKDAAVDLLQTVYLYKLGFYKIFICCGSLMLLFGWFLNVF